MFETKDKTILQAPLLFKYTSTDGVDTIHKYAINHAKKKNISNYEDEYPGPWRTNGKAYINWVVGPKEVQQQNKGKHNYIHITEFTIINSIYYYMQKKLLNTNNGTQR